MEGEGLVSWEGPDAPHVLGRMLLLRRFAHAARRRRRPLAGRGRALCGGAKSAGLFAALVELLSWEVPRGQGTCDLGLREAAKFPPRMKAPGLMEGAPPAPNQQEIRARNQVRGVSVNQL